jgi:uncharacterized protein YjiS (DUF1127 family)
MRTLANTAGRQDSCYSGMLAILGAALKRAWAAFISWRVQQAAIAYLQSMSDRELRDIRLSRAEIEFAVTGECRVRPVVVLPASWAARSG